MKKLFVSLLLVPLLAACQAQDKQQLSDRQVGGPCEGCEAIYEWGDKRLLPIDTLPDFREPGPKLKLTGTIYQADGKTPAAGVILYIYHTNQEGIYPTKGGEQGWGLRHGYLRGWIKSGADGKYTFYTLRPGAYPERSSPAHIHATIKEPGVQEYYIDDYEFEDDPLVQKEGRGAPRGGSGLVALQKEGELWVARRDIILGQHVPSYE